LSYNFGRKVRNLFDQQEFKEVFPEVNSITRFKGRRDDSLQIKGANISLLVSAVRSQGEVPIYLIIDDPHSVSKTHLAQTAMRQCLRVVYIVAPANVYNLAAQ
jgi:hypothetical protein